MTKRHTTLATVALSSPTDAGDASMLISTTSLDRDGDIIEPHGGDFSSYQRNPVVGFQHFRESALPIGRTIRLDVDDTGIRATWRWLEGDAFASRVKNAYQQGVLRAASIGFMPRAWTDMPGGGRRYTEWELAEWSIVNVPSNRQAVRTLKSLGLWPGGDAKWLSSPDAHEHVIELLDDDDAIEVTDELAADARRLAGGWNSAALAGLVEPRFDVNPAMLKSVLREAVGGSMRVLVRQAVARELRRRQGRVE